jgi:hypothetical protein
VDTARSEPVEAELSRLIDKRSPRESDCDERDESWKASVAAYNARKREENRIAWCEYHEGQAERHRTVLEVIVEHHVHQAEMYRRRPEGE